MPETTTRQPGYKNAPFDLPPALQQDFDETAEKLKLPKTQVLSMALAKGLPIIRQFLLGDANTVSPSKDEGEAVRVLETFDTLPVGNRRKRLLESIPAMLPPRLAARAQEIVSSPERAATRRDQLLDLLNGELKKPARQGRTAEGAVLLAAAKPAKPEADASSLSPA